MIPEAYHYVFREDKFWCLQLFFFRPELMAASKLLICRARDALRSGHAMFLRRRIFEKCENLYFQNYEHQDSKIMR